MQQLASEGPTGGFDAVYRIDCAGSAAFLALHAVLWGRSFGGIRIRPYAGEDEALADALALALAMSRKAALAGVPGGGAKAVLIEPPPGRRAAALLALGEAIASLGGRYRAGPDYGFTPDDAAALGPGARWFAQGDLAPATAAGVLAAMEAAAPPRVVAIQGLGAVGRPLAALLVARGARVLCSDVRGAPCVPGVEAVDPASIYDVPCDVFAPCAAGGVLDARSIPRLRCAVVCGAANNPFATEDDPERLRARGITYVPDFLANAGALIRGGSDQAGEGALAAPRMAAIAHRVRAVLARAAQEGRSPHHVAIAMADAEIARLRASARDGVGR